MAIQLRRNSKQEPAASTTFPLMRKRFQKAFGRNSGIQPEVEFLHCLELIWGDRAHPTDRLRVVFESLDPTIALEEDIEFAVQAWMDVYNVAARFISPLLDESSDHFERDVYGFADELESGLGAEEFRHATSLAMADALHRFLDENRISLLDDDAEAQIARRVDPFFEDTEHPTSEQIMAMVAFLLLDDDEQFENLSGRDIFLSLATFSREMNIVRVERMHIRQSMGKSTKGPCPCGSGLKYKVCCFL